jgi:hypothetical protein
MYSVDFAEVETLQHRDHWQEAAELMISAGYSPQYSSDQILRSKILRSNSPAAAPPVDVGKTLLASL